MKDVKRNVSHIYEWFQKSNKFIYELLNAME